MGFDKVLADSLAARGTPVLCVDTCSILDVIRDPTRDTVNANDAEASVALVHALAGC